MFSTSLSIHYLHGFTLAVLSDKLFHFSLNGAGNLFDSSSSSFFFSFLLFLPQYGLIYEINVFAEGRETFFLDTNKVILWSCNHFHFQQKVSRILKATERRSAAQRNKCISTRKGEFPSDTLTEVWEGVSARLSSPAFWKVKTARLEKNVK